MADLKPKKINLAEINGGVQYEKGDGIQPNAINDPIQASAYAQALATNQPNLEDVNNFGTPSVSIEEVGGLPRFKFDNLNAVEISKVEQTVSSTESGGENVLSVYLNNGNVANFSVYNGKTGAKLVNRVLQGEDQDGGNIYLDTFDDGTTAYFVAPRGRTADKISDWMGTKSIGSPTQPLYYDGEKGEFVAYDFPYRAKTLEECSWWEISELSKAGKAKDYFYVGETKTATLTNGKRVTFRIIGFNHDDLSNGTGKAGITFELVNAYDFTSIAYCNGDIAEAGRILPNEIKAFIKSILKKTYNPKSEPLETNTVTLFYFARAEIMPTTEDGYKDEGERYEYYVDGRSLIRTNLSGVADDWFLRSRSGASGRYYIDRDGDLRTLSSTTTGAGLYYGFCI